ncbi:hypothetical protein Tco_0388317, partial [Tanacetum coccineum]
MMQLCLHHMLHVSWFRSFCNFIVYVYIYLISHIALEGKHVSTPSLIKGGERICCRIGRTPVFNDDQFEEESMPVYDTDIEDVIGDEEGFVGEGGFGEEEENMEDVVVVANDLCSSMIQ